MSCAVSTMSDQGGSAATAPGILVVEDEDLVRRTFERVLSALGYCVFSAASGAEALRLYTAHRAHIHAVLTDRVMPNMSGDALCARLKELDPDLPVIMTTGYPMPVQTDRALWGRVDGFVSKPVDLDELDAVLRKALSS